MRICIIGSRSLDKAEVIIPIMDKFFKEHTVKPQVIISGGAKGVDHFSQWYAEHNGLDFIQILPYHLLDTTTEFNSKYFFIRTKQMISNADKVLAIWDTKSKGTEYGIKLAQKLDIPVMVVKVP
jgi:predicted Rossmann fold nucleotide-binding protein DprA/Smf involved in DNA uptake